MAKGEPVSACSACQKPIESHAIQTSAGWMHPACAFPLAQPMSGTKLARNTLILWLVLIVMFVAIWQFVGPSPSLPTRP